MTARSDIFETGAIVQYLGEKSERCCPRAAGQVSDAIQWTYAGAQQRRAGDPEPDRPSTCSTPTRNGPSCGARARSDFAELKLKRVSDWLGDKHWLEGQFTIGDLVMVTVLDILRHTDLVAEFPTSPLT